MTFDEALKLADKYAEDNLPKVTDLGKDGGWSLEEKTVYKPMAYYEDDNYFIFDAALPNKNGLGPEYLFVDKKRKTVFKSHLWAFSDENPTDAKAFAESLSLLVNEFDIFSQGPNMMTPIHGRSDVAEIAKKYIG